MTNRELIKALLDLPLDLEVRMIDQEYGYALSLDSMPRIMNGGGLEADPTLPPFIAIE